MKEFSVSQICNYIKGVFEDELVLHNIWVSGEIEEIRASGNANYFTITDGICRLSVVKFAGLEKIEKGSLVVVFGGVSFYPKTSKISFIAKDVKSKGAGDKNLAFLKLKDKLEKEGVFDKKKSPPVVIKKVALVTSETGSVIEDFKNIILTEGSAVDLALFPVQVQGEGAKQSILKAIEKLDFNFDAVVFMRGGGSAGDLEVFNDEQIARGVASLKIYTISAIGHETDTTLIDYAADIRLPTPSAAASLVANHLRQIKQYIISLAQNLSEKTHSLYLSKYAQTARATAALEKKASEKILVGMEKCRFLGAALCNTMGKKASKNENKLQSLAAQLNALSPLKTIARGFAKTEKDGKLIKSVQDLKKGDTVNIYYIDGKAETRVEKVEG